MLTIDRDKLVVGPRLAVEELDDAHAADVFLGESVDLGDVLADAAVAFADALAEDTGEKEDAWNDGQGEQRQRQLMRSMMMTMKRSTKTSSKMARTPEVNISFRASTSEVTRVTSLPTGLRSKNEGTCAGCDGRSGCADRT